ncbi:transporter [Brevundimonas sp. Leaf363]|uniref:ATP-grasp domain-containing protein n=1 Tax=Brevundimonas sp. Leaf363 TaxID=1736353 RepID=UPI0006F95B6F|nr:hypothetical protein [Brevundimonas sp. Leaf363]KQS57323.1 transporter [Brevundimonas sp. Leaf363]
MTQIAVLTPDPADPSYASQWPGVLARLTQALALAGAEVVPTAWTDHVDDASGLAAYPLVLATIVWGYHRNHAQWLKACATWQTAGVRIANPASVLGWNSDKRYLQRLAERGAPVPETLWIESATEADVVAAFDTLGAEAIVVKPAVSGGAWRTQRLSRGEPVADLPTGLTMIQPYLDAIESEGETSLLFFGGRFSHAVNKRPVPGDFRIQVQYGGDYRRIDPAPETLAVAERILSMIDEPLLYARVDLAPGADGAWRLMELELIEPDFYLGHDPKSGALFAEAVRAVI